MAARFISIGGYTFNADQVLFAEDFMVEGEEGVRVEFIRKGVIFLKGINRAIFDDLLDAK